MSRTITQAAVAAAALALTACADTESLSTQEDTTGEDPGITVAEDGVGTAEDAAEPPPLPPAALPYEGHFHNLWHHLEGRDFVIPRLAALHVVVHATWGKPGCGNNRYLKISLYHEGGLQAGIQKIFRTDGKIQAASWQNLEPGTYYLDFEVIPAAEGCLLAGGISIEL